MVALVKPDNLIAMPQKSNEWYTPARYVEAARAVMGGIELDPASSAKANKTVRAARYYTEQDNGLEQNWIADTVWCNPPFSITLDCLRPGPVWSSKMINEYQKGNMKQGILLMKAETKNPWFHKLFDYLVCISVHRIKFDRPGREPQEIREGVAFVYLGSNEQKFVDTFSQFGTITKRVSTTKQPEATPINLWEVQS